MSTAAAIKIDPKDAYVRRFELPDLSEHGAWMMPRLLQAYPHVPERTMAGFISGQLYSSEMSFLYSKNAVAMAQIMRSTTLQIKPIAWERFVFCRDPKNEEHIMEALAFYDHWRTWVKHQGGDTIIVMQMSDVPPETLAKSSGRLMKTEQLFIKV